MRAAHVTRLFFLVQPIKFLICGVDVVAVSIVDAKAQRKLVLHVVYLFIFIISCSFRGHSRPAKDVK